MTIKEHNFTGTIISILNECFPGKGSDILENSDLLKYINIKTKAANRDSKSRASFANHYAIYVLIEDYVTHEFDVNGGYDDYDGAQFSVLLRRQRELPFGRKLQNHALNHRLNEEYKKYFPQSQYLPIIRDVQTNRYWFNEHLLMIQIDKHLYNIAKSVKHIIEAYIDARKKEFNEFIHYCEEIIRIQNEEPDKIFEFIRSLLRHDVDARIFEIVSYAILKEYYSDQKLYWGWEQDDLNEEYLKLYKTGKTNANDGGIDFVMKPLGRFFQVTETIDSSKYFLDIDKVQKYPITFVVKTNLSVDQVLLKVREQAQARYLIKSIVSLYMNSIEEIININRLMEIFDIIMAKGECNAVINEIIVQSRLEFDINDVSEDS